MIVKNKFSIIKLESLRKNLDYQLTSAVWISRIFGNFMKDKKIKCSIIHFGSIYSLQAQDLNIYKNTEMTLPVEYSSIKASIIQMTKYFAQYFKKDKIRVNCLSPGGIKDNQPKAFVSAYNSFCSKKGMLDPNDVANTLIFLISDSPKFITGQNFVIDDGFSL